MSAPPSAPLDPKTVPPVGLAPEGQDYSHPWIVSAIVSALCFLIGFALLYATGWWARIWQWADAPFMFYFAILLPVLAGFALYGVYLTCGWLFGRPKR